MKVYLDSDLTMLIDAEKFEKFSHLKICCQKNKIKTYAYFTMNGKKTFVHRFVTNAAKGFDVDHINGNGLDNRLKNLRVCTRQQNAMNRNRANPKSGYKGVYWDRDKWRVEICKKQKKYRVRGFETAKEAALKYDEMAKELHGEYANLNFPSVEAISKLGKE